MQGVYPYEYMDSWERLNEASSPDKKSFYSELNKEGITDDDYVHAQRVWEVFKINLGGYHDLYVESDTLLLADVFENFRDKCMEIYELDPAHFLSAPILVWKACLKKTGVELELLSDNDILMMFEKGIRGGICKAICRYAKANYKYMKNYNNKNSILSYLVYLDGNNLYGWAMLQMLPVDNFKWVKKDDLTKFDEKFIKNSDQNSHKGYLLEVDVEYPKNLHKVYNDLPFLSERMKINKCSKLRYTLYDKESYVVHIRALKQALNKGLILKKLHKVIQFDQKAWLKPYIGMNTKL